MILSGASTAKRNRGMNHYFAMLNKEGKCIVTLPAPHRGTTVSEDGVVGGQTGAMDIWNGNPPLWCFEIIEIKSPEPWIKVPDNHKTAIWKRETHRENSPS